MKKTFFLFVILLLITGCSKVEQTKTTPQITEDQAIADNTVIKEQPTKETTTTVQPECRISEDCSPSKYCSNGKCLLVNCPNGQIINHVCKKYGCNSDFDCRNEEVCKNTQCEKLNCKVNLVPQNHKCTYQFFADDSNYITPNDKRVLERLSQLTNDDYSEEKFGNNLKEIYYYVTNINYKYDDKKWGVSDYWQTSDQTIEDGTGDCEDHAILLQSMIEALLLKTFGEIPKEAAYVIVGCVDMNYDGKQDGCHAWNIIDASKLPEQAYTLSVFDTDKKDVPDTMNVVIGGVTINNSFENPKTVVYETTKDKKKTNKLLSVYWQGRKWVELESTWGMPLSYYENKGYPYTSVYRAFNSQENYLYPDFVSKDKKPIIFQDMIAYLHEFLRDVYQYIVGLLK